MSEEPGSYRVEGRAEPRLGTRYPLASPRYQPPTPNEFRSVTQQLNLSGAMVGRLLGVTSRAVRKWIGDESPVPYSAWRLLLIVAGLALEDPDTPELELVRATPARADESLERIYGPGEWGQGIKTDD